jgi:two-component system response regulator WspF
MAVEAMRRVLAMAPAHTLAWTAGDGVEAVEKCARDRPDLILMDLMMPRMNGVEATRRIMAQSPCAILVVTADIESHAAHVFAAMGEGAGRGGHAFACVGRRAGHAALALQDRDHCPPDRRGQAPAAHGRGALVAMGASAGGPGALAAVLGGLPRDFPAAVVIVQHVDARFAPGLVDWLGHHSAMPVRLAAEGERVVPGQVLVAGTDDHLVFKGADRLGYTPHPQDHAYRPSVDVMFASARRHWAGALAGVC